MTNTESFGVRFGRLVHEKRNALGLSLSQLAVKAFGRASDPAGEGGKSRIQRLEAGSVSKPQAKTIKALCDALDVTPEQIAALRSPRPPDPYAMADILNNIAKATRSELYSLARAFGQETPEDLSDSNLHGFLTKKAEEYRTYRVQIDALDERIAGLGNLKAAAQDAAERPDFDEVEALLSRVHEVEADIAAKTAEARAANALPRGQVEQAYRLLSGAADSFAGIDPLEPARRRHGYEDRLFAHGLRYGGPGMALSARMIHDALADLPQSTDPVLWASLQNNLAIALQEQGSRIEGAAGAALLGQAVDAYRAALRVYTRADHPVHWAGTTQNLALALKDQGRRTEGAAGAALMGQAVVAYRAALEVRTRADHQEDWADSMQNFAIALQEQGSRTEGAAGAALLGQAVDAYRAALEVTTLGDHPVRWAMTTQNMANALQEQGIRTGGAAGAALLGQAVAAYRAALEVTTPADHPVRWAMTTQNLAIALKNQGSRTGGAAGAALLGQAVDAYRAALEVRTRADHPVHWAMTQENMALLEQARAAHDTCTNPAPHLRAALDHVMAALTVYDPDHMPHNHAKATRLRDDLLAQLAAL
ncbi:MAG: helix-turn-helix transcriptional regulator [Rhodobacter sp.]|nr:helix-turn-helix transcriptional regulator [Rhodobacter sp.]MCA3456076.1 helix-turn-helix transcriptional regulator [Rhodobacter sp.]MCA3461248.1 helix-turn-helix transcriptional regulator [Rhodobacter sp.]MCA3464985.1 helix-turn-helix transcriptional regulator [Rhodobacter sp.]MCA3469057.1 helix-turn-helix transcriptional regulator [Rhodobacter sp.]